jgi:hypothetical protein
MNKTKVIFRKVTTPANYAGEIVAVFPYTYDIRRDCCTCYQHTGQHGDCSIGWYRNCTAAATPEEYNALLNELVNMIGYSDLQILKRFPAGMYWRKDNEEAR